MLKRLSYEALLIWAAVSLSIQLHLPHVLDLLDKWAQHGVTANEYIERMWVQ